MKVIIHQSQPSKYIKLVGAMQFVHRVQIHLVRSMVADWDAFEDNCVQLYW